MYIITNYPHYTTHSHILHTLHCSHYTLHFTCTTSDPNHRRPTQRRVGTRDARGRAHWGQGADGGTDDGYVCVCECEHIYMCVCVCEHMCVWECVCMCECLWQGADVGADDRYVYVCVYICTRHHLHTHHYTTTHTHTYTYYIHSHTLTHTHTHTTYTHTHIHIHIHTHTTHTHTHTQPSKRKKKQPTPRATSSNHSTRSSRVKQGCKRRA
jgi:hypothetical protein